MIQKRGLRGSVERPRHGVTLAAFHRSLFCTAFVCLTLTACESDAAADTEPEAAAGTPAVETPAADAAATQARQLELITELQGLDQELSPMRERALEDPDIKAQEQVLTARVDAAMEGISPGVLEARDGFDAMMAEYNEARQAGEQERVQTLGTELQGLQIRVQQTQSAAVAQEGTAEAIESFRESLFDWMRAEDPQAGPLLDQAEEIAAELEGMAPPSGD